MLASPTAIPAFNDNYIWALHDTTHCVVVDPGDAAPVEAFLQEQGLMLSAILITHHHPDHVGGISALLKNRDIPVYGPAAETIPGRTQALEQGDSITLDVFDLTLNVLAVPGHTLGHIVFHATHKEWLFCGDTLFAGGCGRLFEGSPEQMHHSLQKLAALPPQTQIFCAHEYTQANLTFAAAVTPDDSAVAERLSQVKAQRLRGEITLPSRLSLELQTNPFLRSHEPALQHACEQREPGAAAGPVACFAALRRWKDNF